MTVPVRLRLSRRPGFNLQALSRRVNGLPARAVTRPGPFGNRFPIGEAVALRDPWGNKVVRADDAATAVRYFKRFLPLEMRVRARLELAGHNVACHCALCPEHADGGLPLGIRCDGCAPCHADHLLKVANRPGLEKAAGA